MGGKFKSKARGAKAAAGDHDPSQCNHKLNGQYIHYKPSRATEGKQIVTIYDNDGTRKLIVPNREPIDIPGIYPRREIERLKNQAHVVTYHDRVSMIEEAERKRNLLIDESEKRRQALQQMQKKNIVGGKLTKIELEAKAKNQYLLQRANELRQEQEDEAKNASRLILATKCRAIRNAQINEKAMIEKELAEEEKRLDMMMEQSRQKALRDEEAKRREVEIKNQNFTKQVSEQVKEIELQRLLEAERKEEESRLLNKALIAMQRDEAEKLAEKWRKQEETKKGLQQANLDMERYRALQKEEERIADMRVQYFMQKKRKEEEKREREEGLIKAAKEREIARLRDKQQRAQDEQAALEELNTLRVQEEVERAWRVKEKEAAIKKIWQQVELREAREKQIDDIRRAQAIEIARDEAEFHKVAKVHAEQVAKDREEKEKKRQRALCHRDELLRQIDQKERERINAAKEKFEVGEAQRIEQEVRDMQIKAYVKQKINKLRETNVPENYVRDVERQLKIQ